MGFVDHLRHPARATLAFWQRQSRGKSARTTNILIACFPKSGSTFLHKTLQSITGFSVESMTYRRKRNEQDMYLPTTVDAVRRNSVIVCLPALIRSGSSSPSNGKGPIPSMPFSD